MRFPVGSKVRVVEQFGADKAGSWPLTTWNYYLGWTFQVQGECTVRHTIEIKEPGYMLVVLQIRGVVWGGTSLPAAGYWAPESVLELVEHRSTVAEVV